MIKVIYGKKGMGKTKTLIDTANEIASKASGDIVFIDDSNQLMHDLKRNIRFINVAEFPVSGASVFLGFICGLIAEDYDIEAIFVDGLTYVLKKDIENLENFFNDLKKISAQFKIDFYMSINGDPDTIPEFLKEYV